MPDLIRHPCVKGDGPRVKPGVTGSVVKTGVTENGGKPGVTKGNVVRVATYKLVMPAVTQMAVMPDLIRHPCVKGDGPRVKPGVTRSVVKFGVTGNVVKPGVTKWSVVVHGDGTHIRATPNVVARGWRSALSAQVSRQKLSTLRVSRGSITPSSSTRPLV